MKENRDVYLDNVPLEEAQTKYYKKLSKLGFFNQIKTEEIKVQDSLGRITVEGLFAKISSPHYNSSAVDGIAVKAEETFGASETAPLILKQDMYQYVNTGDILPDQFNSVIMVENIQPVQNSEIEIIAPAFPWQHVRTIGEDIVEGEMLLSRGHRIKPEDIGGMLAGGLEAIKVKKKPKISIIPTGNELVQPGEKPKPGQIIEYNSHIIKGYLEVWGGKGITEDITMDNYTKLKNSIEKAVKKSDIVIVNAGSSAGGKDYTASVIADLGEVVIHGVASKPGKPVILGIVQGKPVIGIPGYPVSAIIALKNFVKPLIYKYLEEEIKENKKIEAITARKIPSKIGVDEFIRVKLGKVKDSIIATPLARGAGLITSMMKADGILKIPASKEGHNSGDRVVVEILKSKKEIENTIVAIGSHDVALDILGDYIRRIYPDTSLSSAHLGSMGGIMALQKGETHIAGIHLLDSNTGEYNRSYLKKYLPNKDIALVNLAYREQGILVKKGNPKQIKSLKDISNKDIKYVNRQKGSGTRILLDYFIKKENIDKNKIPGYEREEYTHMAVAASIAAGSADAGMAIKAAANSLNLEFIPVTKERYDLAIPSEILSEPLIEKLLKSIKSSEFKNKLEQMGGYSTELTGQIL